MDARKVAFLFGELPRNRDPEDREVRGRLVEERLFADRPELDDGTPQSALIVLQYQAIAEQIADDDPPEVWQTALRLLDAGLEPSFVMTNLFLAATSTLMSPEGLEEAAELEYLQRLERLPLPPVREVIDAVLALLRSRRAIPNDELVTALVARFSEINGVNEHLEHWVDSAVDALLERDPAFMLIPPDQVVHLPTLLDGVVLTHRLTDAEQTDDYVAAGADLAALLHESVQLVTPSGDEVEVERLSDGGAIIFGPEGWTEGFEPGTLLAFRLEESVLSVSTVAEPQGPGQSLIDAARAAYDREVEEPGLPVGADEILAGLLFENPGILSTPTVPFSEVLARAGLEQRGVEFAHDESVWRKDKMLSRLFEIYRHLDDAKRGQAADVLESFEESQRASEGLRRALVALGDQEILSVITDQILDLDNDESQLAEATAFAEDLLGAARRPRDGAPAHWLMGIICERRRDPHAGKAHLEAAVRADPDFAPAIDRLAWYLSDGGDAPGAVRLWRRLGIGAADSDDLREVLPFAEQAPVRLGRNEPCWCGSGRKFKYCHLGQPADFDLADRVGWLCRKAIGYLERRGGDAPEFVFELATIRADGDDSDAALNRAFSDPMVMDVALQEGGWFDRFLEERGALLPDDEALLAQAWTFIDRTLYEVVHTSPGSSITVRDLRSAEVTEVRERTFSRHARTGQVFCGRAVPDGTTHQFVGGIFGVAAGEEKTLLDLLDRGDGALILEWIAAKERPPRMTTREGEDMRMCEVVLEVPEPDLARAVLDHLYEPNDEGQWTESHELDTGESMLRATIGLEGNLITIETLSEPRAERVLAVLMMEIDRVKLVSDERRAFDPTTPPRGPRQPPMSMEDPGVEEAFRSFIAERDLAWCAEKIPALGGLTPRQAADDPAGREALERLLGEYGAYIDPQADPEVVPQHPDRLRRLLGIA